MNKLGEETHNATRARKTILLPAFALFLLAACARAPAIPPNAPPLDIRTYFDGTVTGTGRFTDPLGITRQRFTMDLASDWTGQVLHLTETFHYADRTDETRTWILTPTGPGTWTGTLPNMIGTAQGETRGPAFHLTYTLTRPPGGGPGNVTFDQWLWRAASRPGGTRVMNVANLSKSGLPLGTATVVFDKR